MKIIEDIFKVKLENTYVAIGTFDGVHRGHRELITMTTEKSKKENGKSVVFTFSTHPMDIINHNKTPRFINTIAEKATLLKNMGVDYVILQKFDKKFADMSGEDFVKLLYENLGCREIFVGFNFSFGVGGKSKTKDLVKFATPYGIKVHIVPAVELDNQVVSSTIIRKMIENEEIEKINKYLGHNFLIEGEVVHGKKLARELGFPTANIKMSKRIYPKTGIYGARVRINGEDFYRDGVVNIGYNPTLKPGEKSVEVNIFDFDKMIYGKNVEVELIEYLRPEKQFDNIQDLIDTIANDVKIWHERIEQCKR